MDFETMKRRSVPNFGNPHRILKAFEKARRGEPVTYVALGGSITQGVGATAPENRYASRIAAWWEKHFPDSRIRFLNAGIGATGSLIGLHRCQRDVLDHQPDFVLVEFCVNDTAARNRDMADQSFSNLIHRLLHDKSAPAVLALMMTAEANEHLQHVHLPIVRHYNIPCVSFADAVIPEWEKDPSLVRYWLKDGVHPTDTGHKLVADLVCGYLDSLLQLSAEDFPETPEMAPWFSSDAQNAFICYADDPLDCRMGCFEKAKTAISRFPFGWQATRNGEPLVLRFRDCKEIHVLYEYTNKGTGGKAVCEAAGRQTELDSDFVNGYGVYAHNVRVFESSTPQDVTFTLTPRLESGRSFMLIAVMVS